MTMPGSGTISFGQLRTELGGTGAQSLKDGSQSLWGLGVAINVKTPPYAMSELYSLSDTPVGTLSPSSISNIDGLPIFNKALSVNTSESGWNLDKDPWITLSQTTGSGNDALTVNVSRNTTSSIRDGYIDLWKDSTLMDSTHVIQPPFSFGGGDPCLSPDTPITMADGTFKELGDLVLGDDVMSYKLVGLKDDETNVDTWQSDIIDGELTSSKVIRLVNGTYKDYYIINNIMKITFEHHVFIFRDDIYKFIPIKDVVIGDFLWSEELGHIEITTKEYINIEHPFITLDVEETDVYFAHGMLVHNPIQKDLS